MHRRVSSHQSLSPHSSHEPDQSWRTGPCLLCSHHWHHRCRCQCSPSPAPFSLLCWLHHLSHWCFRFSIHRTSQSDVALEQPCTTQWLSPLSPRHLQASECGAQPLSPLAVQSHRFRSPLWSPLGDVLSPRLFIQCQKPCSSSGVFAVVCRLDAPLSRCIEEALRLQKQSDGHQRPEAGDEQGDLQAQWRHLLFTLFEGHRDLRTA